MALQRGPFELGEPILAKSTIYSYLYAINVLNGPFPLGEPSIRLWALDEAIKAQKNCT